MFVLVYSNVDDNAKRYKARRYYLPEGVIKNYNVIIIGRNFYDQPIDSDINQYEDIKKLYYRMFIGLCLHQKPLQTNCSLFE